MAAMSKQCSSMVLGKNYNSSMKAFIHLKGALYVIQTMRTTTFGPRDSSTREACGSQVGRKNVDGDEDGGLGKEPGDH